MKKCLMIFLNLGIVISSSAQVGIGNNSPKNAAEISATASNPSTSGSSSNGILRIQGNTNTSLDAGIMSNSAASWLQTRSALDYSNNLTLKLNPNGGNITIGSSTPGTSTLNVVGNISASGPIRSASAGQLLNSIYLTESDLSKTTTIQNNSTTATDILTYQYTPVSSSSRIWIKFSVNYLIGGNSTGGADESGSQILVGSTVIQEKRQLFNSGSNGTGDRSVNIFPISGVYDNTSSSAIDIKVNVRRTSGNDVTDVYADMVLSIIEIAD